MDSRALLAQNLLTLKDHYRLTNKQLATRCKVGYGTIHNILHSVKSPDLDTLTAIGSAFGLEPWQLLTANLNPTNPPLICAVTKEEQALYDRLKKALLSSQ